jgi:hypothetical protein
MSAITLTLDAPSVRTVTKEIKTKVKKPLTQRYLESLAEAVQALSRLPLDDIQYLVNQLQTEPEKMDKYKPEISKEQQDLAQELGVEPISDEEEQELENAAFKKFFGWRKKQLEDSFTAPEVAELIGAKSRQTPHDKLKRNDLIAIQDNGAWKFPKWQFDPKGPHGVVDGLPDVLKALDMPCFSKISWLTQPNYAFDGYTPIEFLRQGRKDEVIAEAKTVGHI